MTVVRKFKLQNRLKATIFDGGGKRMDDAVADAEGALDDLAESCWDATRGYMREIEAGFAASVANRDARSFNSLYMLANRIIDASAPLRPRVIADAARCLCDLLDPSGETQRWDWQAVDIHLDALRLLTSGVELGEAAERQLIDNLVKLRQHREQTAAA